MLEKTAVGGLTKQSFWSHPAILRSLTGLSDRMRFNQASRPGDVPHAAIPGPGEARWTTLKRWFTITHGQRLRIRETSQGSQHSIIPTFFQIKSPRWVTFTSFTFSTFSFLASGMTWPRAINVPMIHLWSSLHVLNSSTKHLKQKRKKNKPVGIFYRSPVSGLTQNPDFSVPSSTDSVVRHLELRQSDHAGSIYQIFIFNAIMFRLRFSCSWPIERISHQKNCTPWSMEPPVKVTS